tara:strand:+ start:22 stop:315 length:294 start_codon:yes stop_codon:yes gene_type:complete
MNKNKYVVTHLNPDCVCSLNCPNEFNDEDINEGCLNRFALLDVANEIMIFKSVHLAQEHLSNFFPEDLLLEKLRTKEISIDLYEKRMEDNWKPIKAE